MKLARAQADFSYGIVLAVEDCSLDVIHDRVLPVVEGTSCAVGDSTNIPNTVLRCAVLLDSNVLCSRRRGSY